jgi:hypothetical protein
MTIYNYSTNAINSQLNESYIPNDNKNIELLGHKLGSPGLPKDNNAD